MKELQTLVTLFLQMSFEFWRNRWGQWWVEQEMTKPGVPATLAHSIHFLCHFLLYCRYRTFVPSKCAIHASSSWVPSSGCFFLCLLMPLKMIIINGDLCALFRLKSLKSPVTTWNPFYGRCSPLYWMESKFPTESWVDLSIPVSWVWSSYAHSRPQSQYWQLKLETIKPSLSERDAW